MWDNDNLVNITYKDGDGDSESITISYGKKKNKSNQWSLAFTDDCLDLGEGLTPFLMAGYVGRCSANLPQSVSYKAWTPDFDTTYTLDYELNSNKTIKKEIVEEPYQGDVDRWSYDYVYNN